MIAVEQVDQIEVFVNEAGGITIQQEAQGDAVIVAFPASYAAAVCKAIREAAKAAKQAQ